MNVSMTLDELEQALHDERRAIVALDADAVFALAERKLDLMRRLDGAEIGAEHATRFAGVVHDLRNNCMLLANARDLARGAVESMITGRRGVRVSVTG